MNFKLGQVETGKVSGAWQPRVARLLALEWLRLGAVASPCLWDWPECGQPLCPNPPTPVWNVLTPSPPGLLLLQEAFCVFPRLLSLARTLLA